MKVKVLIIKHLRVIKKEKKSMRQMASFDVDHYLDTKQKNKQWKNRDGKSWELRKKKLLTARKRMRKTCHDLKRAQKKMP